VKPCFMGFLRFLRYDGVETAGYGGGECSKAKKGSDRLKEGRGALCKELLAPLSATSGRLSATMPYILRLAEIALQKPTCDGVF
jgi:hypothetical protein